MQVVSFALSAVYSGMWFLRWATDGVKMWGQLGWFSGLMCVGSVAGAAAWGAKMRANTLSYEGIALVLNAQQQYAQLASASRWAAAFSIIYPVELLCFIAPKLMMLGRLTNIAARRLQVLAQEQEEGRGGRLGTGALARVCRGIAAAVVLCCLAGMVALDVAAAYTVQAAALLDRAAAACDAQGNDTNSSLALLNGNDNFSTASSAATAVQVALEAVLLLLISSAYLLLVPLSVAMSRRAERSCALALLSSGAGTNAGDARTDSVAAIVDDTMQAAVQQRRHLVIACVIVLLTFPARAAYDLINAYSSFNNAFNPACAGPCDACQPDQFLINVWLAYTPEFQPLVVALSSPLPLLVSLWIITGAHARAYTISLNILRARLGK